MKVARGARQSTFGLTVLGKARFGFLNIQTPPSGIMFRSRIQFYLELSAIRNFEILTFSKNFSLLHAGVSNPK